jgi:hypothetical protein
MMPSSLVPTICGLSNVLWRNDRFVGFLSRVESLTATRPEGTGIVNLESWVSYSIVARFGKLKGIGVGRGRHTRGLTLGGSMVA